MNFYNFLLSIKWMLILAGRWPLGSRGGSTVGSSSRNSFNFYTIGIRRYPQIFNFCSRENVPGSE